MVPTPSRALTEEKDCEAYIGDHYEVEGFKFTVDADNAEAAQRYVDQIRAIPGKRFVEVELEYSSLLGIPKTIEIIDYRGQPGTTTLPVGAGTGDCVVLDYENRIVWVVDLKFGKGDVVYASYVKPGTDLRDPNEQLGLYGAAAVAKYDLLGITDDWKVQLCISQPRIPHFDTHGMTVGELKVWIESKREAASRAYVLYTWGPERIDIGDLKAGEKQCRWCPLSGPCKAQTQRVLDKFPVVGAAAAKAGQLLTLDDQELSEMLLLADEVERYFSAARAEGLQRALQGRTVPNWKIVEGRRGNREFEEEYEDGPLAKVALEVDALLEIGIEADEPTQLPINDAIDFALGAAAYKPKQLQTVAKLQKPLEKKAPLLWAALQAHITQAPGKSSLERMEDPRPPIVDMRAEFPTATPAVQGLL